MPANLGDWFNSPRAQGILREERLHLAAVLPSLFGRTMLQIGNWGDGLLQTSAHWRTGVVGPDGRSQVVCALESLPLVRNSVDAILLPHSLEFTDVPHRLLRETDRTLTPRGQLVILGFNPWSWWGLRQRLWRRHPAYPAGLRPLGPGRLCEWLSVLDYEVVRFERFGPKLRLWPRVLRFALVPFSANYLILARKRSLPVSPLRERWRKASAGMDVARLPSARSGT